MLALALAVPTAVPCAALVGLTRSPVSLAASPQKLVLVLGAVLLLDLVLLVSVCTARPATRPWPLTWLARLAAVGLAVTPGLVASWVLVPQIRLVDKVLVSAPVAYPSPLAPPATAESTTSTSAVESTIPAADSRITVLLLGGDAGPGRWGLRTDSMNVVSLDTLTGDTVLIGIPRNLREAPLPPGPLRDRFPDGFPDLINAVYGWGESHPDEVRAALGRTDMPGASLVTASVSELTGLRIDAFALVDMQGFIEIVDAIGGVDVYVPKFLPAPGNVPGALHPVRDMEPGWQFMDGTDALSFVRSRSADSDYGRMSRQRCLLASLAAQQDPLELVSRWPSLVAAVERTVRTNATPELLVKAASLPAVQPGQTRTLALTPPQVPSRGWSPTAIRAAVASTITPPSQASETPVRSPDPVAATTPSVVTDQCRLRP